MNENMNKDEFFCEFLVIGSGAGGAVACKYLTDLGKDVLLIEEGDHHEVINSRIQFQNHF